MGKRLIAEEMAPILRRSVAALYRDCRAGRVPFVRVAGRGRYLFDPEEVKAALQRHPAPPAATVTTPA